MLTLRQTEVVWRSGSMDQTEMLPDGVRRQGDQRSRARFVRCTAADWVYMLYGVADRWF